MKKLLVTLIVLLHAGNIFLIAQDYSAFVPGREAYFVYPDAVVANGLQVDGVHADSVGTSGAFTEYRDYRREVPMQWSNICLTIDDTSWLGHSILLDAPASKTVFRNRHNDSIIFSGTAGTGQQGMICILASGDKLIGTVTSVTAMTFMNVTDSVKTITLQAYNSSNNMVSHIFNGRAIWVSKTRGLVRAYNWKNFPHDTASYVLHGMTNPIEGIVRQNAASIFNYNIGDRFDFEAHWNPNIMSQQTTHTYITWYVTGKTISSNGDTVSYTFLQDRAELYGTNVVSYSTAQPASTGFVLSQQDANSDLDLLPEEFADGPDTNFGYAGAYPGWPYDPALYNGRSRKSYTLASFWDYDYNSSCYYPDPLDPCQGMYQEWADGIGQVYGYIGSQYCFTSYNLRYYEKGAETWGTPHDWGVILSAPEQDSASAVVRSWPNPANDVLNIALPGAESKNLTYQIYTVSGQLAVSGNAPVNGEILQIPVNQLAEGAYTVVISGESQTWISRFVR